MEQPGRIFVLTEASMTWRLHGLGALIMAEYLRGVYNIPLGQVRTAEFPTEAAALQFVADARGWCVQCLPLPVADRQESQG